MSAPGRAHDSDQVQREPQYSEGQRRQHDALQVRVLHVAAAQSAFEQLHSLQVSISLFQTSARTPWVVKSLRAPLRRGVRCSGCTCSLGTNGAQPRSLSAALRCTDSNSAVTLRSAPRRGESTLEVGSRRPRWVAVRSWQPS
jgi:hypothetical protein